MRRVLALAIFAAFATAAAAQPPTSESLLDRPLVQFRMPKQLPECGLETALASLAKETGLPIGMERTPECERRKASAFPPAFLHPPFDLANTEVLVGVPVREVLGRIAALATDYAWAIMEGVAVFRPASAWSDANNALAAGVPAMRFSDANAGLVMFTILNVPLGRPASETAALYRGLRLSIDFPGGTLLDALNSLVRTQPGAWYVSSVGETAFVGVAVHPNGPGVGFTAPIPGLFARR